MKILLTGGAGFIGFHLCRNLLNLQYKIDIIDNFNDYYGTSLKDNRVAQLLKHKSSKNLRVYNIDICDTKKIDRLFKSENYDVVLNLAAQAGVRYSLENPHSYIDSNIKGFMNILEGCRHNEVKHLIYASSSSVYGLNTKQPFDVNDNVDFPISLYAATKKSNELMAHTYSHLFGIPATGLRFFTVYGPWGRPDMAYFKFTEKILSGKTIDVFNNGKMKRDFTFIDDVIKGIIAVIEKVPVESKKQITSSLAPHRIYNIGNNKPVTLKRFINAIEDACGVQAKIRYCKMQPGDVIETYASIESSKIDFGYDPKVNINDGVSQFVKWYKEYQKNN